MARHEAPSSATSSSAPESDRLRLRFVQTARADRNEGRRRLLLRTLDAVGIGFDT